MISFILASLATVTPITFFLGLLYRRRSKYYEHVIKGPRPSHGHFNESKLKDDMEVYDDLSFYLFGISGLTGSILSIAHISELLLNILT